MAELGLIDVLFAAIPDGIEHVTYANFKRLWRYYGMARLHSCFLLSPSYYTSSSSSPAAALPTAIAGAFAAATSTALAPVGVHSSGSTYRAAPAAASLLKQHWRPVPARPCNLAYAHPPLPGCEDYRLFVLDLYRAVTDRMLVLETLEQRIWAVYMLYTVFVTQSPPPGRTHEPVLLPQAAWPVLERCREEFFRLRRLTDPRRVLTFLLSHKCFVCSLEGAYFPHSGLDLDQRGDREDASALFRQVFAGRPQQP